jgi:hypothetical protein
LRICKWRGREVDREGESDRDGGPVGEEKEREKGRWRRSRRKGGGERE